MTDRIANMRLRIREKATGRTWLALWPWDNGFAFCMATGTKRLITTHAGFSEYNDRGEPVLDSWIEPTRWVV